MGRFDYVFFNLAGSLVDCCDGVAISAEYALGKVGVYEDKKDRLKFFVNNPLNKIFRCNYNLSVGASEIAEEYFWHYFEKKGALRSYPFKGTVNMLANLKRSGRKAAAYSPMPEIYVRRILQHHHLSGMFECIAGALPERGIRRLPDIISYAIEETDADPSKILIVGDSRYDIASAKMFGIKSAGVLFANGCYPELLTAKADYIVSDLFELAVVISG